MSTDMGSADIPRTMRASVLVARRQVRVEERPVPVPAVGATYIVIGRRLFPATAPSSKEEPQ